VLHLVTEDGSISADYSALTTCFPKLPSIGANEVQDFDSCAVEYTQRLITGFADSPQVPSSTRALPILSCTPHPLVFSHHASRVNSQRHQYSPVRIDLVVQRRLQHHPPPPHQLIPRLCGRSAGFIQASTRRRKVSIHTQHYLRARQHLQTALNHHGHTHFHQHDWIRTFLPSTLLSFGTNAHLGESPVIQRGADSGLVISHYGSMPGRFAAVLMFPETESAIVVLTNSTPLCDVVDYVTQFLAQVLFDMPQKVDVLAWVRRTVEEERKWYPRLVAEMDCGAKDSIDL
jgi:hypothetical protein